MPWKMSKNWNELKVKKSKTYRDQTTLPSARATIMPSNLRAYSCYELVGFGGKPVRFQSGWYDFKPGSNQLPLREANTSADLCLQVLSSWSAYQIGKWIPERLNQVVVQLPDAWNLILPLVSTSTRATDCFRFMLKVKRSRGRHSAGRTATTVPFAPFFTMPWITQMPSTKTLVNQRYPKQPSNTQRHTADWVKCVVEKVYQSKIVDRLCPCLWGSWFISSLIINKLMIHVHMSSGKLNRFDKGRNMGNWNTTIRQGGLTGLALAACHYQRRIWPVHLMRPEENSVFANLICWYVQSASKLHTTANFECLCWVVTPSHYHPAIYICFL